MPKQYPYRSQLAPRMQLQSFNELNGAVLFAMGVTKAAACSNTLCEKVKIRQTQEHLFQQYIKRKMDMCRNSQCLTCHEGAWRGSKF